MKKENIEKILKVLNETGIDIDWNYYIDFDNLDIDDNESLSDQIENQIRDSNALDVEIIYYSNAIKFLQENDPSLQQSLEIANDFGYTVDNLDSEILASLLASQMLQKEFSEDFPTYELDELQDELQDEEEEDEEEDEEGEKNDL